MKNGRTLEFRQIRSGGEKGHDRLVTAEEILLIVQFTLLPSDLPLELIDLHPFGRRLLQELSRPDSGILPVDRAVFRCQETRFRHLELE